MFYQLYKLPVVTARIFMSYGPGQADIQKLIPYVTLSLLKGEAPKLSSGSREVDWIYVEDVVSGLLAAGTASNVEGGAFDLGTGFPVSIRTVVEKLGNLVQSPIQPLFGALPERPFERVRSANTSHSFEKLGWKSKVTLEEGLIRTVEWYREHLHEFH
jgi:nucleoside-diphosphate-sugar epimerase